DDDLRAPDLTTKMLQVRDGVLAVDRMIEVLLADSARRGQPNRCRDLAPLADATQHRRLSLGSPRRTGLELEREPGLVDEDAHGAPAVSLFLMRGQSRSSQARINSSSRSRARTVGTCTVQPKSLSRSER